MKNIIQSIMRHAVGILLVISILTVVFTFFTVANSRFAAMGFIASLNSGLLPFIAAAVLYRVDRWLESKQ